MLKADLDAGEGQVIYQSWMESVDDLMSADLCMDWGNQIEDLRQDKAERYFGWVEKSTDDPKTGGLAKVIPFSAAGEGERVGVRRHKRYATWHLGSRTRLPCGNQ